MYYIKMTGPMAEISVHQKSGRIFKKMPEKFFPITTLLCSLEESIEVFNPPLLNLQKATYYCFYNSIIVRYLHLLASALGLNQCQKKYWIKEKYGSLQYGFFHDFYAFFLSNLAAKKLYFLG